MTGHIVFWSGKNKKEETLMRKTKCVSSIQIPVIVLFFLFFTLSANLVAGQEKIYYTAKKNASIDITFLTESNKETDSFPVRAAVGLNTEYPGINFHYISYEYFAVT